MEASYPLKWPPHWPRTPEYDRRYDGAFELDYDRCLLHLERELWHLGAENSVVSSNLKPDDHPRRTGIDPGVAVYFSLDGQPTVMPQDRYSTVYGNLRSITLAIEGLRQTERHGGAHMLRRAFDGFAALPGPPSFDWQRELEPVTGRIATLEHAERAFRVRVKQCHPDAPGGSTEAMIRLNRAMEIARAELSVMPKGAI